jgi:type IV secretion system protein TrbL
VLSAMADAVSAAAVWLMDQIGGVITATTTPLVGAVWFKERYQVMLRLALVLLLTFLLAGVVQAVLRQDPGLLLRAVVIHLPLAVVLACSAVQLVQLSISVTDQLSATVAGGDGQDVAAFMRSMAADLGYLAGAAPPFIGFFVALVVVAGGFLVWLELVVRSAAVDAATLFLPLALATMVWPAAASVARRLVDVLAALVLSKLVVVGVLSLGTAALAGNHGFAGLVTGAALLLLATLSPAALLRLIPVAEFAAVTHLAGAGRRAVAQTARSSWTLNGLVAGGGAGTVPEVVRSEPVRNLGDTWSGVISGVDNPLRPTPPTPPTPPGDPPAPEAEDG